LKFAPKFGDTTQSTVPDARGDGLDAGAVEERGTSKTGTGRGGGASGSCPSSCRPGVPREPQLPAFLRGFHSIDLRPHGPDDRDQIRKLVAAIHADRPRF
jgi:hypothetical protein